MDENKVLIEKAILAREKSYSPYSKFKVGASVLMEDGQIYSGCNIENASYSPTVCAERTAIFKGVSEGNRKILKIAIIGSSEYTYPCGVCRQVIKEFESDTVIIIANSINDYKEYKLEELFPHGFGPKDLNKEELNV